MNFLSLLVFILLVSAVALTLVFLSKHVNKGKVKKKSLKTNRDFGFATKAKSQQSRSTGFVLQALIFLPILLLSLVLIPWAINFRQTTQWELHLLLLGTHTVFFLVSYLIIRFSKSYRWED